MKKPRLLIFDFDGTALGGYEPYAQFPPVFVEFLNGLDARGIWWATNTTWAPEEQWKVMRKSGVLSIPALLSGHTGRKLARVDGGRLVHDVEHEQQIAAQDAAFRARIWPRVRQLFASFLREDLVSRLAFDYFEPQCMIDFTARPECEKRVWALVQPLLDSGDYYEFHLPRGSTGMLLPSGMNKGNIVTVMQRRLGVGPEETIVAGDAANDRHMFDKTLAHWMVCPANAEEAIVERVRLQGGLVSDQPFSWGVTEGVNRILSEFEQSTSMNRKKEDKLWI